MKGIAGHATGLVLVQEKFDERWQAVLLPKLAEEDMHARTDEAAVRRQRLDKAQVQPFPPCTGLATCNTYDAAVLLHSCTLAHMHSATIHCTHT